MRKSPAQQVATSEPVKPDRWWLAYALAVALPLLTVLLRRHLPLSFEERPMLVLFVFPIMLSALLGGLGPGLIATAITALCTDYFIIPPYNTIQIDSPFDLFQWLVLLANGLLISVFSESLLRARREAERGRLQKAALFDQLHESEERFRQLAEHTSDIFWMREWPDQIISYASPAFETITGLTVEALYRDSSTWLNAIHPEDRERAWHEFEASVETGQLNMEYRFVRPDGGIRWVHCIGTPVRDQHGHIYRITSIARDITEHKLQEIAIRYSENRYRALTDQALPSGLFVHDHQGCFVEVNRCACESLGYNRDELLHMTVFDIETDFDLASAQAEWVNVEPCKSQHLFGHHRRKDGTTFPVEVHFGLLIYDEQRLYVTLVEDISERQAVEQAMLASKAILDAALASTLDAVLITDAEGRFIDFNAVFASFHKFSNPAECAKTLSEYPDILGLFVDHGEAVPLEQWPVSRALRARLPTELSTCCNVRTLVRLGR